MGGAVAVGALGAVSRLALQQDDGDDGGALVLSADAGSDVRSLDVPLTPRLLPQVGARRWRSDLMGTSTHTMLALTWTREVAGCVVHVRSRVRGVWGTWERVPLLHDLPDRGSADDHDVHGTDLVWVGHADGVQVQVAGVRPPGLSLLLLYPEARAGDADVAAAGGMRTPAAPQARRTDGAVAQPEILTRADWGADESWRSGQPRYNSTIQQVHVHHTANSNDYAAADVPALIRGIYRYHTRSLGWSDIGYNVLVDRFGTAWEGRFGGIEKAVRGAHTLGFNATSTGISVIGNFEAGTPASATLETIAAVAAWKLDLYGRDPLGTTQVESEGSDRYPSGRTVTLPVLDGHRDTNDTACPGQHLYDDLPAIRKRTAALITSAHSPDLPPIVQRQASRLTGAPELGSTLTLALGRYAPADAGTRIGWLRDGVLIPDAAEATYTPVGADVGHQLTAQVVVTRSGYDSLLEEVPAVGLVRAASRVTLTPSVTGRRAVLAVVVDVPGTDVVPVGQVAITLDGRRKVLNLLDGRASTRYVRLRSGEHPVTVEYLGSTALSGARTVGTVTIG